MLPDPPSKSMLRMLSVLRTLSDHEHLQPTLPLQYIALFALP